MMMECLGFRLSPWVPEEEKPLQLKDYVQSTLPGGKADNDDGRLGSSVSSCSTVASRKGFDVDHLKALTKDAEHLTLSDFDLQATVGTGTYGRVRVVSLKAKGDTTPLALKVLKKAKIAKMKQVQHLKDEVTILRMVEHPFIVNHLQTFQDDKRVCILMEFVNGGELFSLIRNSGHLEDSHAKFYAANVALAFEYLHSMKVAYRDLKPENILLDCDGYCKLTDFGFAKVVGEGMKTYTLCGTPEYMAPEVIRTQGHGWGIDWWALGVLIFEMLSGDSPFASLHVNDTYKKALEMKVTYPKHLSIKVKDLIGRLLKEKVCRLGCLAKGTEDVKNHKWFKEIDWQDMYAREIAAPWIPNVNGPSDTSYFRKFEEKVEGPAEISATSEVAMGQSSIDAPVTQGSSWFWSGL